MTNAADLQAAATVRFGEGPAISAEGLDGAARDGLHRLIDRRSCRDYAERAVPEGLVSLLIAAGLSAPTKSDLQQADVVWVRDRALRAELMTDVPGADWIAKAPVFLVVCGNGARFASLFEGRDFVNNHFDALFNAIGDAAIVLEGIVAAAAIAGLGTCPISQIRNRAREVSRLLDLPDRVFPFAGVCLGHPAHEASVSPRLDLGMTVHQDRYDTDAFQRLAPGYDTRRNVAKPFARQRAAERFGTDPDYGWREDKRRQYSTPERADFGAYLRDLGFAFD
ncbi:MAG: nitroreductase family protein [Paracoccaceae bacterium]|nr:nitroreductase family protein [Paracoccaceae bacterium]